MSPLCCQTPPLPAPLLWLLLITASRFLSGMVSVLRSPQPQKTTDLLPFYLGLPHEPRQPVKDIATEYGTGHKDGCASIRASLVAVPALPGMCHPHCCLDKASWMLIPDASESKVLPFLSLPFLLLLCRHPRPPLCCSWDPMFL